MMKSDSESEELVVLGTIKGKEKSDESMNIAGHVFFENDCIVLDSNMVNTPLGLPGKQHKRESTDFASKNAQVNESVQINSMGLNAQVGNGYSKKTKIANEIQQPTDNAFTNVAITDRMKRNTLSLNSKKSAKTDYASKVENSSKAKCRTILESTPSNGKTEACYEPQNSDSSIANGTSVQNDFGIITHKEKDDNKSSGFSTPEKPKLPISYKYTVKFRSGAFEREFYMNDDDPVEMLYQELFGDDSEKKLLYEDMKLSRFLLAGESGFFPGVNYVYLPENELFGALKKKNIVLKFNADSNSDVVVQVGDDSTVSDILQRIKESKGIDVEKKVLIFNGEVFLVIRS
ncbi:uncharacterized protein VICG_01771 [Vittaforma corneae ATCC 50505]|uniref:Ubiquitin-like domain-containing protein n=1 Tax=Vittaforma corneae (strain ATCC 50505) TaxID=993615 RepID=L2GLM0_VITCO|nr:uncharacterized protein VICG_01771 [Vittaforma corneae ATCC 50505]ELA41172.1 hypothetical protein VICG_01771 [Vittaforma corneae ATCC 50505]